MGVVFIKQPRVLVLFVIPFKGNTNIHNYIYKYIFKFIMYLQWFISSWFMIALIQINLNMNSYKYWVYGNYKYLIYE